MGYAKEHHDAAQQPGIEVSASTRKQAGGAFALEDSDSDSASESDCDSVVSSDSEEDEPEEEPEEPKDPGTPEKPKKPEPAKKRKEPEPAKKRQKGKAPVVSQPRNTIVFFKTSFRRSSSGRRRRGRLKQSSSRLQYPGEERHARHHPGEGVRRSQPSFDFGRKQQQHRGAQRRVHQPPKFQEVLIRA